MVFFLLDITDHYPIFTIAPINCPQKWILAKFRDHSGQNLAKLKFAVEHYLNNHVQINQDVSANTNNFVITYSLSIANVDQSKKKVSLNRKHGLFWRIRMALIPLIIMIF